MPLYMCQPPTGYDDTAEAWVSAGALVTRMNFAAQQLASGNMPARDAAKTRRELAASLRIRIDRIPEAE